jgi:hypothetical protein
LKILLSKIYTRFSTPVLFCKPRGPHAHPKNIDTAVEPELGTQRKDKVTVVTPHADLVMYVEEERN